MIRCDYRSHSLAVALHKTVEAIVASLVVYSTQETLVGRSMIFRSIFSVAFILLPAVCLSFLKSTPGLMSAHQSAPLISSSIAADTLLSSEDVEIEKLSP